MSLVYLLFLLFGTAVNSLFVSKGSPCSADCKSQNGTTTADLVCSDSGYYSTANGRLMQTCLTCQGKSLFINNTVPESDQYWYLFHMKYTQQFCLFDATNPYIDASSSCATECAPLKSTLEILWLAHKPWHPQYAYCSDNASSYTAYGPSCADCLRAHDGMVILGNFVETMLSACVNKAFAANEALITTDRDLFATATIPSPISSSSMTSLTSLTSSTSSVTLTSSINSKSSSSASSDAGVTSTNIEDTHDSHLSSVSFALITIVCLCVAVGALGATMFCLRRKRQSKHSQSTISATQYVYQYEDKDEYANTYEMSIRKMDKRYPLQELYGHALQEKEGSPVASIRKDRLATELPA